METSKQSTLLGFEPLTPYSAASPARMSQWLDAALDWLASGLDSSSSSSALPLHSALAGLSSRMSPAFSVRTKERTWRQSLGSWPTSGMGGPTECLTLNTSEYPSGAVASSLSDVLETGELPPRFSLSPKAAAGILRRAERRERDLPTPLLHALQAVALRQS